MIYALMEKDELSADEIAEMAKGKLKKKVNQLVEALNGNVTDHHRFLLKQHLGHIDFLVEEIKEFDEEIRAVYWFSIRRNLRISNLLLELKESRRLLQ
ncbi:MAG: hypothetical protein C5S48_05095 [Candidatus Methanogaster sp.]|nr:MAG: hypothetical protein C5S48_05095 [ANME-2 cluster archaeon]